MTSLCSMSKRASRADEGESEHQNSYYANYDHIMLLEDHGYSIVQESTPSKVVFLATCAFISMFGGFALNVAISGRRYRKAVKVTADPKNIDRQKVPAAVELEDPVILATRALGWGSLYAMLGSGAIGLAAYYVIRK